MYMYTVSGRKYTRILRLKEVFCSKLYVYCTFRMSFLLNCLSLKVFKRKTDKKPKNIQNNNYHYNSVKKSRKDL